MEAHRPNPTFLSIARMAIEEHDFKAMALERLAAQYPELDFVFDKLTDVVEDAEELRNGGMRELEEELSRLEDRMYDAREQIGRVVSGLKASAEFTGKPLDTTTVSELELASTWLETN